MIDFLAIGAAILGLVLVAATCVGQARQIATLERKLAEQHTAIGQQVIHVSQLMWRIEALRVLVKKQSPAPTELPE